MAQFLTVALKASMIIPKKRINMDNIPVALAKSTIEENFDLSLYDHVETDHNLIWKLKDTILSDEITLFLDAVLKFYYDKEAGEFQSLVREVSRTKTYDGLLKVANENVYDHFTLDNNQYSQYSLKKIGKHLRLDFNMIQFFMGERMRMDNFDKTMMFLSNSMQKVFSEFQLSKALGLYIYDDKYIKR